LARKYLKFLTHLKNLKKTEKPKKGSKKALFCVLLLKISNETQKNVKNTLKIKFQGSSLGQFCTFYFSKGNSENQ